jgi:2-polyprenyl-3-methyl-5-hydroxy-6-metoxy-1,4-benzoquinol methylase
MYDSIEISLAPVSTCPLCGDSRGEAFDAGEDSLLPEINRYLPVGVAKFSSGYVNFRRKCFACGLIYLAPRPASESLSQIYASWYGYAYKRVMTDPAHVAERRREFERYHLRMLEANCPRRGHLLDVGCGSGLFLGLAKQKGWKVTGIEFDSATANWGRQHEGVEDMRCGVLGDVLEKGEAFDAITMFDYLEHTDRPGDDLDCLISHLAPGGILMIRVPNAGGWQARMMGSAWIAIIPTHLSYFSRKVLADALLKRGLEICHLSATNYRTEIDILKQRVAWFSARFRSTQPAALSGNEAVVAPGVGKLAPALRRWLVSLAIEQVDHVGGWFGAGNNLTVITRKMA